METDIDVPPDIIEAVRKIENWAKRQTSRDDWAIGGITCRAGTERVRRELKELTLKKGLKKSKNECIKFI